MSNLTPCVHDPRVFTTSDVDGALCVLLEALAYPGGEIHTVVMMVLQDNPDYDPRYALQPGSTIRLLQDVPAWNKAILFASPGESGKVDP